MLHVNGVLDVNVTGSSEVEVPEITSGTPLKLCAPGLLKVIAWLLFCTVSVKDCIGAPLALLAVKVSGYVLAVPVAGVPARVALPAPGVNVTPAGSAPTRVRLGAGVPVAVTAKLPAERALKRIEFALVNTGGTGVAVGVTPTVADGPLVSVAALVAVTEQV